MKPFELREDDLVDQRGYIIAEFCCETNVQTDVVNRLNSHAQLLEACKRAAMQWRAYHQLHNEHDIEDESSEEGDCYRFVEAAIAKAEAV